MADICLGMLRSRSWSTCSKDKMAGKNTSGNVLLCYKVLAKNKGKDTSTVH
jgi:hypothetical protein